MFSCPGIFILVKRRCSIYQNSMSIFYFSAFLSWALHSPVLVEKQLFPNCPWIPGQHARRMIRRQLLQGGTVGKKIGDLQHTPVIIRRNQILYDSQTGSGWGRASPQYVYQRGRGNECDGAIAQESRKGILPEFPDDDRRRIAGKRCRIRLEKRGTSAGVARPIPTGRTLHPGRFVGH